MQRGESRVRRRPARRYCAPRRARAPALCGCAPVGGPCGRCRTGKVLGRVLTGPRAATHYVRHSGLPARTERCARVPQALRCTTSKLRCPTTCCRPAPPGKWTRRWKAGPGACGTGARRLMPSMPTLTGTSMRVPAAFQERSACGIAMSAWTRPSRAHAHMRMARAGFVCKSADHTPPGPCF